MLKEKIFLTNLINMGNFNEWMAHIYSELGYPKETIDLYLRNTKTQNNEKLSGELSARKSIRIEKRNDYQILCLRSGRNN